MSRVNTIIEEAKKVNPDMGPWYDKAQAAIESMEEDEEMQKRIEDDRLINTDKLLLIGIIISCVLEIINLFK